MPKLALYPVHFYCPQCGTRGTADAREFFTDAGTQEFVLGNITGGFTGSGVTAGKSAQRMACSCGHVFTPDLIEGRKERLRHTPL